MKDFQSVVSTLTRDLRAVCLRYGSDRDADLWYQDFINALDTAHTDSWSIGRALAGDDSPNDILDAQEGILRARDEVYWLDGFYEDLKTGRYDVNGKLNMREIQRRSSLYVPKIRGTTNIAFDIHSPSHFLFDWILGGSEEHCPDCPYFARTGPYPQGGLPAYPGDGSTPCLFHCKCWLRRDDGVTGILPITSKNYPTMDKELVTFLENSWFVNCLC